MASCFTALGDGIPKLQQGNFGASTPAGVAYRRLRSAHRSVRASSVNVRRGPTRRADQVLMLRNKISPAITTAQTVLTDYARRISSRVQCSVPSHSVKCPFRIDFSPVLWVRQVT